MHNGTADGISVYAGVGTPIHHRQSSCETNSRQMGTASKSAPAEDLNAQRTGSLNLDVPCRSPRAHASTRWASDTPTYNQSRTYRNHRCRKLKPAPRISGGNAAGKMPPFRRARAWATITTSASEQITHPPTNGIAMRRARLRQNSASPRLRHRIREEKPATKKKSGILKIWIRKNAVLAAAL